MDKTLDRLPAAKDWTVMNEEEKYHEWSHHYYSNIRSNFGPLDYVTYCDRFDQTYGVANARA